MASVFILYRDTFWNDIDHTSWWDVVDVFSSQTAAKSFAQDLYNQENPNTVFEVLKWTPNERGIATDIEGINEYWAEVGNFYIEEHIVKDGP
jgi:hypothetical protein